MTRCPWKIRWTSGQDARCDKDQHVSHVVVTALPDGRSAVDYEGDPGHASKLPNGVTTLSWETGDRREFTGYWPGPCPVLASCTLHLGHHGRCAP